ncbi:hypothetical protein GGR58DRAFT_519031 [Xylaria digitata]|nr:hypothetical protein GGR58DRAFT_519031 [Xylaria digitata]
MDFMLCLIEDSSTSRICQGLYDLSDLLQNEGEAERFIILLNARRYILFLTPMPISSTDWDSMDATDFCWRSTKRSEACVACLFSLGEKLDEESVVQNMMLSMIHTEAPGFDSVADMQLPGFKKQCWDNDRRWFGLCTRANFPIIVGLSILLIVLILGFALFSLTRQPNNRIWQRYNTAGSHGPLYQLQFDHNNVSEWEIRYPDPSQEWFLRIDDQAMIPLDLVDDEELRYQHWFQQRYPEADRIRLEGKYLTEAFLSDPSAIQVPADKTFHMAHCVVALRRYWTARESKSHVCPRDIDFKHVKHCLDALDMWAFPEGPRQSIPISPSMDHGMVSRDNNRSLKEDSEYWIDTQDDTRLVWRTKVCFRGFE